MKKMQDYSGFLWFFTSILLAIGIPYFWANDFDTLFGASAFLLIAVIAYGPIITLMKRIKNFSSHAESTSKLLTLYFEIFLLYSSVYLWLSLFSNGFHFNNMVGMEPHLLASKETFALGSYLKALATVVIDAFHFSVVTGTTLGYGDVTPSSWIAKLVVDSQVLVTIWVVVIGYGKVSSKA